MLKIRDLGINVIPAIENGPVYEQYLDTTYPPGGGKGGKKGGTGGGKKGGGGSKKSGSKKGSKKAAGFGYDDIAQLRQQLEDRIGTGH